MVAPRACPAGQARLRSGLDFESAAGASADNPKLGEAAGCGLPEARSPACGGSVRMAPAHLLLSPRDAGRGAEGDPGPCGAQPLTVMLRYMHLAPSALTEAIGLLNFGQPVGSASPDDAARPTDLFATGRDSCGARSPSGCCAPRHRRNGTRALKQARVRRRAATNVRSNPPLRSLLRVVIDRWVVKVRSPPRSCETARHLFGGGRLLATTLRRGRDSNPR